MGTQSKPTLLRSTCLCPKASGRSTAMSHKTSSLLAQSSYMPAFVSWKASGRASTCEKKGNPYKSRTDPIKSRRIHVFFPKTRFSQPVQKPHKSHLKQNTNPCAIYGILSLSLLKQLSRPELPETKLQSDPAKSSHSCVRPTRLLLPAQCSKWVRFFPARSKNVPATL